MVLTPIEIWVFLMGDIFDPPKKLDPEDRKPPLPRIPSPTREKAKPDDLRLLIVEILQRIEALERDVEAIKKRVGMYA